jgi:hypothetical protein
MIEKKVFKTHTRYYDTETGFVHRLDGAAIEYANGENIWYYQGRHIKCSSQEEYEQLLKMKAFWK